MAPFIQIEEITKRFGDFIAVDNLSLDIDKGALFCLLGGSGCGKTTLLRMLAGLEAPTSGRIKIDGMDMKSVHPADRPVNYMFQNYALFPHMNVASNIGYGLRRAGISGAEYDSRIAEMVRLVRLEGFEDRKPDQLSGGQKQRVALARALARRPKLLLLDEPLAALDKKLREDTQFELVNIQEQLGTTFVVVTHDQEEAMSLASEIGVMDKGRLVQTGPPRHLYEAPRNRFIADFLGSVSFLEAVVTSVKKDVVQVQAEAVEIKAAPLDDDMNADEKSALSVGEAVTVALRPEKINLKRGKASGANEIDVVIEEMAYLGSVTHIRARTKTGDMLKILLSNRRRGEADFEWDEQVVAYFDAKDARLLRHFDDDRGQG